MTDAAKFNKNQSSEYPASCQEDLEWFVLFAQDYYNQVVCCFFVIAAWLKKLKSLV